MSEEFLYRPSIGIEKVYYSEADFFERVEEEAEEQETLSKVNSIVLKTDETLSALAILPDDISDPLEEIVDGIRYIVSTVEGEENKRRFNVRVVEEEESEEIRGTVLIEYVDVFLNKIREEKRLTRVSGNIYVSGDYIPGYELIEPKTQFVEVTENREYIIRFVYDPIYEDAYSGIDGETSIKDAEDKQIGGILVVEYFDDKDNRLKESKVFFNQLGYKEVNADYIEGYTCIEPSIVAVDIKRQETTTVRFIYQKDITYTNDFEEFLSGTIVIKYMEVGGTKEIRNRLTIRGTLGGTYYAPDIPGYRKVPPSSEHLNIVYDKQVVEHTFYYAKDYDLPDFDDRYEFPEFEDDDLELDDDDNIPLIDIEVDDIPKPIIIKNDYTIHTIDIIDDFLIKLRSLIAEYVTEVESILNDFDFSPEMSAEIIRNNYSYRTRDIINKNFWHISDLIISNQIRKDQKVRMFKKLFNKRSLQKQLRSCKLSTELRARYYEETYMNTDSFSDLIRNKTLADKRLEYDEKYKESFLDLYKLLNSSVIIMRECLEMSIKEIQGKAILAKREGLRFRDDKTSFR